jgi:hypothetical protein
MAATKYQILYRATNKDTGITISNKSSVQVEHLAELYHDKHKILKGNEKEKKQAIDKKNNDIINGNDANNVKYTQLYQYSGTKRVRKLYWVPETIGYVIRDFDKIRDKITNTNFGDEYGDYSGDYLLFEGDTPENGVVVSRVNPMIEENFDTNGVFEIKNNDLAENKSFYSNTNEVKQILVDSTIGQIDWEKHPWVISLNGVLNGGADGQSKYFILEKQTNRSSSTTTTLNYYNLSVFIGGTFNPTPYSSSTSNYINPKEIYDFLPKGTVEAGFGQGRFPCTKVVLNPGYIKTYKIPGHWEESYEAPYAIQDVYEKVAQEPWFPYSTEHSLEKALEKASALIEKIGLENVKLVKVVPTNQFLKTK